MAGEGLNRGTCPGLLGRGEGERANYQIISGFILIILQILIDPALCIVLNNIFK